MHNARAFFAAKEFAYNQNIVCQRHYEVVIHVIRLVTAQSRGFGMGQQQYFMHSNSNCSKPNCENIYGIADRFQYKINILMKFD